MRWGSLIAVIAVVWCSGCMTMTGARPLEPGEHQVGATLGGPMVNVGGIVTPLPNIVIEGRHGVAKPLDRNLDVNYGLNATALAFGIAQLHVGGSFMVFEAGGFGLSVTDRVFFASNVISTSDKAPGTRTLWGANQTELTASYMLGQQLVYLSLSEYLDFGAPSLLLTPALGFVFDPGKEGGLMPSLEFRYYAVNRFPEASSADWFPGDRGALGVGLGLGYRFGGCSCKDVE